VLKNVEKEGGGLRSRSTEEEEGLDLDPQEEEGGRETSDPNHPHLPRRRRAVIH